MGFLLEITEKKVDKLSEHLEQGLRHLGKAMSCVDEWMQEGGMGERGGSYGRYGNRYDGMNERESYGGRGGYGYRSGSMGYRDDDEDDDEEMMERRGRRRRSNGRYY